MKRNLLFSILALVPATLIPLAASCQIVLDKPPAAERPEHTYKWEAFAGYGYTSLNQVNQVRYGLQGVNASITRDFGKYFGVMAEGDYYFKPINSGNPVKAKVDLALAGPVVRVDIFSRYSAFVRVLIGAEHTAGTFPAIGAAPAYPLNEVPKISFAGGFGGGMEYKWSPRISIRASGDDILSSFVEDPDHLGFSPHRRGNTRAALGVVYRF